MGGKVTGRVSEARMGDILRSGDEFVNFEIDVAAGAPIERIEIRNRTQVLETWRPWTADQLGRRVRIIWEGSEYRGRGRQSVWDGTATLEGNSIETFSSINLWNIDKRLKRTQDNQLAWSTLTTGGFGGAEILLKDGQTGTLKIDTSLVKADIPVADIGLEDQVLETGAGIKRRMRVFRMPDVNDTFSVKLSRRIPRNQTEDAIYICITLEDGNLVWSSPTYLLRQ
jgi:hypothetical protein